MYRSKAADRTAQQMLTAVASRSPLVVLTGEAGVGKTMVFRSVLEQIDSHTLTAVVTPPMPSAEDLLVTLLVEFGVASREDLASGRLAGASRQELGASFREFLGTLGALDAFALLIVDDAHALPAEVLEELRSLVGAGGSPPVLQIVLVGDETLARTLKRRDRRLLAAAVRCELEPLERDELPDYISHQIAAAGGSVQFDTGAVDRIWAASLGVPRLVNDACTRALARGAATGAVVIGDATVSAVAAPRAAATGVPEPLVILQAVLAVAVLLVLAAAGAAAAAFVFEERLARLEVPWDRPPAPLRVPLPQAASPIASDASRR